MNRRRGRPRNYEPDAALEAALCVFWKQGYAGASLDDISAATGMARPSLYAAFGDKKSLYRKCLDKYNRNFLEKLEAALSADAGIEEDLVNFYKAAASVYRSGDNETLGCATICTAMNETTSHEDIQSDLASALDQIDTILARRFKRARKQGELKSASADPRQLGQLAAAVLHSLALRIRADQSSFNDKAFIKTSVATILNF